MRTTHFSRFLRTSAVYLAVAAAPALAVDGSSSTILGTSTAASGTSTATAVQPKQSADARSPSSMLFARYRDFVGSDAATRSLIQGLRYSELIDLGGTASAGGSSSFAPPTRAMGWGSANRALSLTRSELASLGIMQPSADQLRAALTGGTLVTASGSVQVQGVLTLRGKGMGWGAIAHTVGVSPSGKPGSAATSSASKSMLWTSASRAEQRATESGRVRVSISAPHSSADAGDDAQIGHGAIVTAGGAILGDAGSMRDSRSGTGIHRAALGMRAGVDSSSDGLASASAQGEANAHSMGLIGSGNGNQLGSSIRAGVGAGGGLGLGRR